MGTEEVVLRIGASSEAGYTKRVAGAMGWRLREKGFFKARAVKQQAVNTAIKAIAIVNKRVAEAGVVLSADLFFSQTDGVDARGSTAVEMTVHEVSSQPPAEFLDYRVSGSGEDSAGVLKLAGAIAGPAREGKGIRLRCIGSGAVYKAVMACVTAKGYIYANGMEASFVPSWESMPGKDELSHVSLIRIDFWGTKIDQRQD